MVEIQELRIHKGTRYTSILIAVQSYDGWSKAAQTTQAIPAPATHKSPVDMLDRPFAAFLAITGASMMIPVIGQLAQLIFHV